MVQLGLVKKILDKNSPALILGETSCFERVDLDDEEDCWWTESEAATGFLEDSGEKLQFFDYCEVSDEVK